jgi:hypothetical protein
MACPSKEGPIAATLFYSSVVLPEPLLRNTVYLDESYLSGWVKVIFQGWSASKLLG